MEKMTKKQKFELGIETISSCSTVTDEVKDILVSFFENEIELLNKKKSSTKTNRKPTERQLENETFKDYILDTMEVLDKPCSVTEVILNTPIFVENHISTQRLTPIFKKLMEEGKVVKPSKLTYALNPGE